MHIKVKGFLNSASMKLDPGWIRIGMVKSSYDLETRQILALSISKERDIL